MGRHTGLDCRTANSLVHLVSTRYYLPSYKPYHAAKKRNAMTHNTKPDYEALAAEVITLMATMRPSQRPPRRDGHQTPCPADLGPVAPGPTAPCPTDPDLAAPKPTAHGPAVSGHQTHDSATCGCTSLHPAGPDLAPHSPADPGPVAPDTTPPFPADPNSEAPDPAVSSPAAPLPPAIPPDLMEIGRGSIGVLEALSRSDKPATPGQIGLMTGLSKGRVSNIIRGLEEKGYVTKHPSPTDNRSVTVALSAKGQQVTRQHHDALRAHVASILRQLGPQDAQDGVRVMRHLLQIMQANCMAHEKDHPCCAFATDSQQETSTPIFHNPDNPDASSHPSPCDTHAFDGSAPLPSDAPSRPIACAAPHKQHTRPACPGKNASPEVGA